MNIRNKEIQSIIIDSINEKKPPSYNVAIRYTDGSQEDKTLSHEEVTGIYKPYIKQEEDACTFSKSKEILFNPKIANNQNTEKEGNKEEDDLGPLDDKYIVFSPNWIYKK
jgi:hypothetical protein